MKKNNLFLSILSIVSAFSLASCNERLTYTPDFAVIQMDVNPQISFVLDDQGLILSVYGDNNEGKLIIHNEELIGKDFYDALEIVINVEAETGYLVSGKATSNDNNISFTISTKDDETKQKMEQYITKRVSRICDKLKINEKVMCIENASKEYLKDYLRNHDNEVSEEEIEDSTFAYLCHLIKNYQLERINYASKQLEELYNQFKEYQLQYAENEYTLQVIDEIAKSGSLIAKAAMAAYKISYEEITITLNQAIDALYDTRYEYFINETSAYQTVMKSLRDKKAELLEQKAILSKEKEGSEKYSTTLAEITLKETQLEDIENRLESIANKAKVYIDYAIGTIGTVQTSLDETLDYANEALDRLNEKTISEYLKGMTKDYEKAMEVRKEEIIASFDEKYKDELDYELKVLTDYKNALKQNHQNIMNSK